MFDWLKGAFAKKQTVNDTVEAYGKLLEEYPLSILDDSMLPLPKAEMKILFKALYAKTSNPQLADHIETGFMFLSKFQHGVGAPVGSPNLKGTSKEEMAADIKLLDNWLMWGKLSLAETEILMAEWKRFKEGEPI
jgi:hypothetical protein